MQKNNRYILTGLILSLIICTWSIPGHSQEDYSAMKNREAFRRNMKMASKNIHSVSSEFIQNKHLSFLEEDVESKGSFYFEKVDKLRWEYTTPFEYLIIFRGDTVIIQDDEKTSTYDASTGMMFREISQIMLSMVNGSILESERFAITYLENEPSFVLELEPLQSMMSEFLSAVRIFINKENYTADELYMIEPSGDYTRIRFINKALNEDIPDQIFKLP